MHAASKLCTVRSTPVPNTALPLYASAHGTSQAEGVPVSWSQTTDEVLVKVPVAASVRGRDVGFEVHPTRLRLAVDGAVLLEGNLSDAGSIKVDGENDGRKAAAAFKGQFWLCLPT